MPKHSPVFIGMLIAALSYAGFTCFDTVVKMLAQDFSVFQVLATALIAGAFFMAVFTGVMQRKTLRQEFRVRRWKLHILHALSITLALAFYFVGFMHISLATFYVVLFTVPPITAMISVFFLQEKPSLPLGIMLGLSFAGTVIALRPWGSMAMETLPWVLVISAGTIFNAASILILRRMMKTEGLAASVISKMVLTALAFSIPAGLHFVMPNTDQLALMLLAGLFYAVALKLFALSLRFAPASLAAATQFLQLIYGSVAGIIFFAERPSVWVYVGGAIVIGANLCLLFSQRVTPADPLDTLA